MKKTRLQQRREDAGGAPASLCTICVHKWQGAKCAAFPDEIPQLFNSGYGLHTNAYPGDNGIRYERNPIFGDEPGLEELCGPQAVGLPLTSPHTKPTR